MPIETSVKTNYNFNTIRAKITAIESLSSPANYAKFISTAAEVDSKIMESIEKKDLDDQKYKQLISLFRSALKKVDAKNEKTWTYKCFAYESSFETPASSFDYLSSLEGDPLFEKSPPFEQRFVKLINAVTVGHLAGDSFLEGLTDEIGIPLEGNSPSNSMKFFSAALEYLSNSYPGEFSNDISSKLKESIEIAELIEGGQSLTTIEELQKAIQEALGLISNRLEKKRNGDSLLIPIGWGSRTLTGHAMLMEVTKRPDGQFDVLVFNTGAGISYHDSTGSKVNTINRYVIPVHKFTDRMQALLEIKMIALCDDVMKYGTEFKSDDIYDRLKEFKVPLRPGDKKIETLMKEQKSGTCSFRCLMAYYLSNVGSQQYKKFKSTLEKEIVNIVVRKYPHIFLKGDAAIGGILSNILPNLFRQVEKKKKDTINQEDLNELEGLQELFNTEFPKSVSVKTSLDIKDAFPEKSSQLKEKFSEIPELIFPSLNESNSVPYQPTNNFYSPKYLDKIDLTAKELSSSMRSFIETIKQYQDEEGSSYSLMTDYLIHVGRIFTDPVHQKQKEFLIKSLRQNEILCHKLLDQVFEIVNLLRSKHNKENFHETLANQSALVFVFEIGRVLDDLKGYKGSARLDFYGIIPPDLSLLKDPREYIPSFLNPVIENDYFNLVNYFSDKDNPRSFKFKHTSATSKISLQNSNFYYLKASDPEIAYAKTLFNDLSKFEKEEADSQFYLQNQKLGQSIDNWRGYWSYVNSKLPIQFLKLREMCMIAQVSSNFREHSSKEKVQIQFSSLTISPFFTPETVFSIETSEVTSFLKDPTEKENLYKDQGILTPNYKELPKLADQNEGIVFNVNEKVKIPVNNSIDGLQFIHLIDRFKQSLHFFHNEKYKVTFWATLFQPGKLRKALNEHPDLKKEILNFLDESITHFDLQTQDSLNLTTRTQTVAFLLDLKQRFLNYLIHFGYTSFKDELLLLRSNLRDRLKNPDFTNDPKTQEQLFLSLIDSYSSSENLSHGELKEILFLRASLSNLETSSEQNKDISNLQRASVDSILAKHSFAVQEMIKGGKDNDLFYDILNLFETDSNRQFIRKWEDAGFPKVLIRHKTDTYTIDLMKGLVYKNMAPLKSNPNGLQNLDNFKEIFGKEPNPGSIKNDIFHGRDQIGKIYYKRGLNPMGFREINHELYRNIPISLVKDKFPPFENIEKLQAWIGEFSRSIVLIDPSKKKILYIVSSDGKISFPSDFSNKYEWVDLEKIGGGKGILEFNPNAILLQNPKHKILLLPGYKDENGSPIEFEEKLVSANDGTSFKAWVWKNHPHLFISADQKMDGIRNFKKFLIVQNLKGDKEALFLMDRLSAQEGKVARLKLSGNKVAYQTQPIKNYFYAYTLMMYARTPEDYHLAFDFIKASKKYERLSKEELKFLDWIVFTEGHRKDGHPDAQAIRVFAATKIIENYRIYPNIKSDSDKLAEKWNFFGKQGFNNGLKKFIIDYQDKNSNVQEDLKILNWMEKDQIFSLGILSLILSNKSNKEKSEEKSYYESFDFKLKGHLKAAVNSSQVNEYPPFLTRYPIDRNKYTQFLWNKAKSTDPIERARIYRFLENSLAGKETDNNWHGFNVLLWAAYYSNLQGDPLQLLAKKAVEDADKTINEFLTLPFQKNDAYSLFKSYKSFNGLIDKTLSSIIEKQQTPVDEVSLKAFWEEFLRLHNPPKNVRFEFPKKEDNLVIPSTPYKLPASLPSNSYFYNPSTDLFSGFLKLHRALFEIPKFPEGLKPPHTFKCREDAKPFIKDKVKEMDEDYREGFKKNWIIRNTRFLKSTEETARDLIAKRDQLVKEKLLDEGEKGNLEKLKNEIIKEANSILNVQPRLRVQIKGYKKLPISYSVCENLFLQGNLLKLQELGNLNEVQARAIFKKVGNYLEKVVHNDQRNEIIDSINTVEKTLKNPYALPGELAQTLRKCSDLLAMEHQIHTVANPGAALVFEKVTQKRYRDHQIEGLNDLLSEIGKPKNRFVQRLQASGKSEMWSPIVALYKADGYHLSVHVTPIHQYQSTLPNMGERSEVAAAQKQRTLIFDDSPAYFTEDHLNNIKNKLIMAVIDRNYINTTIESLRSMRTKYLKTALEIVFNPNKLDQAKINELRKRNALLLDIITILRERGAFTFDESHQAMDPHNVLNMPYGKIVHPDVMHCELLSKIILLATQSSCLKLKENRQSQLSESQQSEIKNIALQGLLSDKVWLKRFGALKQDGSYNEERIELLQTYFSTPNQDLPDYFDSEKELDPQLAILAHQALAEDWLIDAFKENVLESFGIHHQENGPPIAIPFLANLVPLEGSEYSDRFAAILKTLIAYQVQGITELQTVQYIELLRRRALQEYEDTKVDNPAFKYADTEAFKEFLDVVGMDLSKIDPKNESHLDTVKKALAKDTPSARKSLNDFVIALVITQMELFNSQVSTNAQNTATMAKIVNGFSGTLDEAEVAPIMDIKGTTVDIKKDFGTNGQTIDLLQRENSEVHVVSSEPLAIFRLINSFEKEKQSKVRAIIDIGCHFRGKKSYEVAEMCLAQIHNDKITTILFFDEKSNKLNYMKKSNPGVIHEAHNVEIKKLLEELGCESEDELFGVFDQFRITGTNLKFSADAIGIKTYSEQTVEDSELQGTRRMRGLDDFQRVITVVQKGSLDKIGSTLGKDEVRSLSLGEVKNPNFISDLLLYSKMKRAETQMPRLFSICIQKMSNIAEQFVLDKIMAERSREEEIIREAGELYIQSSAIDLVKEFSKKKVNGRMDVFLNNLKTYYMNVIRKTHPHPDEWRDLHNLYDNVIKEFLEKLESELLLRPDQAKPETIQPLSGSRDATVNHIRTQESLDKRKDLEEQKNIDEQKTINANQIKIAEEKIPSEDKFFDENFGSINDSLQIGKILSAFGLLSVSFQFSNDLFVSPNFISTLQDTGNFLDPYQKGFEHYLLICDTDPVTEKKSWKLMLCSIKESEKFIQYLNSDRKLPMNRQMWMLRPQGDLLWKSNRRFSKSKVLGNPDVRKLFVQALFIGGNIYYLTRKPWRDDFSAWLKSLHEKERNALKWFFENKVLKGPSLVAYRASILPTLF